MRASYPKIAVVSDDTKTAASIRRKLSNGGIYTSVMSFGEARAAVDSIELLIISLSRYSSPAQALFSSISKHQSTLPIIAIGNESLLDKDVLGTNIRYTVDVFGNCIFEFVDEILPFDLYTSESSTLVTHLYNEHFIVYRGVRLYFTTAEASLIHYLARAAGGYAPSGEIAEALSISPVSVPVFINSINTKAKLAVGIPMIKAKRNHGYYPIGDSDT